MKSYPKRAGPPDDVKAIRPEVPWPQVRTIGNVLRHEYHGLSDRIISGVVIDELPALKEAVLALNEKFNLPRHLARRKQLSRLLSSDNSRLGMPIAPGLSAYHEIPGCPVAPRPALTCHSRG
ncbi:DUF86 domain-containing protein [Pararhizobium sp. PWRC1-1]|uniref:HepT-like ribonuclease domain-containing protein n=1 Tax=Pararhizobium sp. PWRC1-1 TaxID=2804566 RepID=UPI003CF13F3A